MQQILLSAAFCGENSTEKLNSVRPVRYPSFLATFWCLVIALPGQRRAFPFLESPPLHFGVEVSGRGGGVKKKNNLGIFIDVKWKVCRNSSRCFAIFQPAVVVDARGSPAPRRRRTSLAPSHAAARLLLRRRATSVQWGVFLSLRTQGSQPGDAAGYK